MAFEQYLRHADTATRRRGVNATLPETKPGTIPPSMRERLSRHRTQSSCNGCHSVIDPLGFSLENFDAIGGWRTIDEAGKPIDASGSTANGEKIDGLSGLREGFFSRSRNSSRAR